ncbi:MAG: ABC transporter [Flavonifractor plautii]
MFGAFLLAFIGIGAMRYNLQAAVSNFEYVLSFASLVFVVIVPILTMRGDCGGAAGRRPTSSSTPCPSPPAQVIAGQVSGPSGAVSRSLWPSSAFYPLIFAQFGDVYLLTSYGSILAFFLLGAALIAVGVFLSSLTDNQGLAAGLGIAVILLNYYSVSLAEYVSSTAFGSLAALLVLILVLLGAVVRYLTRNETAWPTASVWCCWPRVAVRCTLWTQSAFEGPAAHDHETPLPLSSGSTPLSTACSI